MLTLLFITLAFAPLAFASVEPWALGLLQLSLFTIAARLYITGRATQSNPLYKNLLPAILLIAALGLLQALNQNPVNAPSRLFFTTWRPATLNAVNLWLFYAAALFITPQIINTPERFKKLMWMIFSMGVLVALVGLFQKSEKAARVYGLWKVTGDAFGPFINRDHGANFLLMTALVGLGLFFSGFRQLAAHQSRTRLFDLLSVQFLNLVMVAGLVYGIYKCGSRGGLHSFALVAAAMGFTSAWFIKTKKFRFAAWAGLALLTAGYCVFVYNNRLLLGYQDGKLVSSVTIRFSMYKSGLEMFKDFPLAGVGLGAVEHAFPFYAALDIPTNRFYVGHVHSDWLELFLQTGLLGGLIYLAGLLGALFYAFKTWAGCHSFRLKALYGGALAAVLGALAHNFVEFGSQMPANALFFYTLLGALASKPPTLPRHAYLEQDEEEPAPPAKPLAAAAALAALLLGLAAVPAAMAWWYNYQAKEAPYELKVKYHAAALQWRRDPKYAFLLAAAHYNKAMKQNPPDAALLAAARQAIYPYLTQTPVNHDLNRLNSFILTLQSRPHPPKH
ncbi:MAG: hypothetical protein COT18_05330 [Elusimicrobia bacterium CG08_land_8_20_14_0_20_59_10]|nr:MAG: hypothetical protein COT18_05330 [Elusimicrobia bacterium CG08_land_8_20_14_0_20_59_10]